MELNKGFREALAGYLKRLLAPVDDRLTALERDAADRKAGAAAFKARIDALEVRFDGIEHRSAIERRYG